MPTKADGTRFKFLVRETHTRILIQEIWIQVAHRTNQVSRTRNMADDRDDEEYILIKTSIFFQETTP